MGMFDEVIDNAGEAFKGGKGFEHGTHDVIIMEAKAVTKSVKNDPKAAVIEVIVAGAEDESKLATCTLYFHTEGGAKMSVGKVLGLIVHKVSAEKKDAVRNLGKKLFGSIEDPTEARDVAVKLINDKLIGEKAFLVAEPSGKYKTTSYGDLWHYPAEPETEPNEQAIIEGEDITNTKEAEAIPDFNDDDL
jgi:hypothetical protein